MKTIQRLFEKAQTKGYAKERTWELEQVQGQFIRLKHYGTTVLKVDYTTEPVTIEKHSTSASDTRGINALLDILRLDYPNTLNGFKRWAKDNPSLFSDDNISEPKYYKDKNGLYVEEVWRQLPSFLGGDSIKKYRATFEYNENTKSFQFVKGNLIKE